MSKNQEKQARKLLELVDLTAKELEAYHSLTEVDAWNARRSWFPELRDSLASASSSLEELIH